ncbi:uncharacterized protein [Anabrus simplex]|uniref:uncharacterized protein n=1 Tax=Anabrus simplex TaxID=316456 RepID=UPI0034DDBC39
MVRVYKRKTSQKAWTEEDAEAAVESVRQGMSLREAAHRYKIPRTSIIRRAKGFVSSRGGQTVLSSKCEKKLKDIIIRLQERGFEPTRDDVRRLAYEYVEENKLDHPFNKKQRMAGSAWFASFIKRHNLTLRKPTGLFKDTGQEVVVSENYPFYDSRLKKKLRLERQKQEERLLKEREDADRKCGFCERDFSMPCSAQFASKVQCQSCLVWYHEVCVGATSAAEFTCGKCRK